MSEIIQPGAGIIFMKVGTHAQESLEVIIKRKQKEIEDAGYAMWGYGGGTCHPMSTVQPFAKSYEKRGGTIYLCMEQMESHHFAEPLRAEQSSADGVTWAEIPKSINVLGSRFALIIKELREDPFAFCLGGTKVAMGNQVGKKGSLYISGRVDKACLEVVDPDYEPEDKRERLTRISVVAKLEPPYAVFLRNRLRQ